MPAFSVAANGQSVETANGPNQLLSMSNPFTKLDTTNIVSFQTIQLIVNHEPPQPPPTSPFYTDTIVYQFKHGYDYIPSVWLSWQFPAANPNPGDPPSGGNNQLSFPNGDDSGGLALFDATQGNINQSFSPLALQQYNDGSGVGYVTAAFLCITADATNVYIHLIKNALGSVGGATIPLFLIGYVLSMRTYVFTEPATTSTY